MPGGRYFRFPDTVWTRIRLAGEQEPTAIEDFVRGYHEPVRKFLLSLGVAEKDAEDIVQEIFMHIMERGLLEAADRNKGRFRSYLLGITKNILHKWKRHGAAAKRGGGLAHVSLDDMLDSDGTKISDLLTERTAHDNFDLIWTQNLVERAMNAMKAECESERLRYFEALSIFLDNPGMSYAEISARMNVSEQQLKNYLFRAKKMLTSHVRGEIASYCSSPEEFADEVRYLSAFMS